MTDLSSPVVLDNGSGLLKAGYAGSDLPEVVFQNFLGRPKHERIMAGVSEDETFFGHKAEELKGILRLAYPISHGVRIQFILISSLNLILLSDAVCIIDRFS
jgi:centractin